MRALALMLPLALAACSQPDPKDPGTTPTGTAPGQPTPTTGTPGGTVPTDPYCGERVTDTWPEAGRQNVYYRTAIEFWLDPAPEPTDALVLTANGSEVPGSTLVHPDRLEFVPDAPLAAATSYTVGLAGCPQSEIGWSTSLAGDPVDTVALVGTTYAVDIESGRWLEPVGIGALLAGSLTVDILVGVQQADATSIQVIGGVSEQGSTAQDLCVETADFPPADFGQNPYFEIGPQALSLTVMGADIEMSDLHLTGSFRPDFAGLEGATLEGTLDTRGLVDAIDPGGPDSAVCDLLLGLGVACGPCPDGTNLCVAAVVDDLVAPAVVGPLVPRTAYDIAGDPTCP